MTVIDSPTTPPTTHRTDAIAAHCAAVVAAWSASGAFGDHVVYERHRRWTFAAGVRARIVLTHREIHVDAGETITTTTWTGDPSAALSDAIAALGFPSWRVYGWIGFDFCAGRHHLADLLADDVVLAHLVVPIVEAHVDADGVHTGDADAATADRLRAIAADLPDLPAARPVDVRDDADDYRGRVATAVDEIRSGRYHKVVLSREVPIPFPVDIAATYVHGRAHNTPARSFLLSMGGLTAAGFSPELVVAVDGGRVVTEPLAGTRALDGHDDLDARAREDLLSDSKEIAEHAMSVRACVDEIASVSTPGSTVVDEFMAVRLRGSVQHLASTVSGRLGDAVGAFDALGVLFPSITASGIPKAPAVEAIYRLEPTRRGLYSGAVVVASSDGDLEATLALRTVYAQDGRASLRAGAGVVDRSTPDREFEETCEKLASVAPFVVPDGSVTPRRP